MDRFDPDVVIAVVGPLLTALLAGVGLLLKEWRTRRRWEHRRDEIIEQGRRQVAFISDWVVAYDTLKVPDQDREPLLDRARHDLDEIYDSVAAQTRATAEQRPARRSREAYVRSVLLLGVRRPWAKISRILYLAALAYALLSGALLAGFTLSDDEMPFYTEIGVAIFVTGFSLIPAALLHVLTRYLDRPSHRTRASVDGIFAEAPESST
ncbi:hypothetical protein ACI3ET_13380 [Ornithinimicrobium sp. LYQ121]|uniref:hypothetical protein n=1 Tax=Ornithinimicrobium sp. LYQ121 TaxID=3378801 RepID=UPI0038522D3F